MNVFDDIPEDRCESQPCPKCHAGDVKLDESGLYWECSNCNFQCLSDKIKKEREQ